jgi:predicted restriction endonuclease
MRRNFKDPQYINWRKQVYERDQYTCQWPNCKSNKKLNAHHIKTWAGFPGLRFDINNGITLCKYHHDLIKGLEEEYSYPLLMTALRNKNKEKPR